MNLRNVLFTCLSLIMLVSSSTAQETMKSFKVAGTCGMCKKKIEETAIKNGATRADWDKKEKMLELYYDASKVSEDQIKKAIAEAGYDTDAYKASEAAYNNLHECCKYTRGDSGNGSAQMSDKSCGSKKQCKKKMKCDDASREGKCARDKGDKHCEKDNHGNPKSCCKKD